MINEFREMVQARLSSIQTEFNISAISYRLASEDAMYPHIVWDITTINPREQGREDITLDVHVWARSQFTAYEIAEAVLDLFYYANVPVEEDGIYPTFYETSTFTVDDPDKSIIHVVARLEGQVYDVNREAFTWQT